MPRGACLLLLGALLAAAAPALAHPADEYETHIAEAPGVILYLTPQAAVPKAGRDLGFHADLVDATTYRPLAARNVALLADLPGQDTLAAPGAPHGSGFQANLTLPVPGSWNLTLRADGHTLTLPLRVWPDTDVRIESSELRLDLFFVNATSRATLVFVDDATSAPLRRAGATATARITAPAHGVAGEVPLEPTGEPGAFRLTYRFDAPGTWLVRAQSDAYGIDYDDLPPHGVRVQAAAPGTGEGDAATPGIPVALLAVVGALVARARR